MNKYVLCLYVKNNCPFESWYIHIYIDRYRYSFIYLLLCIEPKDPSLIYKYKKKEEYSGELEGIIVLCFLAIFFAVIFKVGFYIKGHIFFFKYNMSIYKYAH